MFDFLCVYICYANLKGSLNLHKPCGFVLGFLVTNMMYKIYLFNYLFIYLYNVSNLFIYLTII